MRSAFIAAIALFMSSVHAQTYTTTNAVGITVVEVITDVLPGGLTTEILETITTPTLATTTSTTPTTLLTQTTATTTTKQQGPVGQPAPTTVLTPGGPTPYTYTTTNAAGETVTELGTFIPTAPATVLPSTTTTGSVMNFSSYQSIYGTVSAVASGERRAFSFSSGWYGLAASTVLGLGCGAWFILL